MASSASSKQKGETGRVVNPQSDGDLLPSYMRQAQPEVWLDSLGADVVALAEVKIKSKQNEKLFDLPRSLFEVQDWDVYESLCSWVDARYGPLFGMVAYVRRATLTPKNAEKSLMLGKRNKELKERDRIGCYPDFDELGITDRQLNFVDGEGRNLVIDLESFVLILVYMPNLTEKDQDTSRRKAKDLAAVHRAAVEGRARELVKKGISVLIKGDFNFPPTNADGCVSDECKRAGQAWYADVTSPRDLGLVDLHNHFHSRARGRTYFGSNQSEGTRIDLALASPDLLPLIVDAGIDSTEHDSDHRPIFVDFVPHARLATPDSADGTLSRPRIVRDLEERLRRQSGIFFAVPKQPTSTGHSRQASSKKPKTKAGSKSTPPGATSSHSPSSLMSAGGCPMLDLTADSSDEEERTPTSSVKRKSRSTKASSVSSSSPKKKSRKT